MHDRFDVFLEALRHHLQMENASTALNKAIQSVDDQDALSANTDDEALNDIHYADRYGKGE